MIGNRRVLGAAVAAVLVASLGALAGCASDDKAEVALTGKQVQAASVTLTVHDVNGAQVGQGAGILIAPRLVLTSGHLVAGNARWSVTSADGMTKVNGIRGMTYDWMDYDNGQLAHPRRHDVAVIYLDKPINLAAYPKIASEGLANNAAGTRLRSNGSAVLQLPQTFKKVVGFPHAYLTDMPSTESVEPGNAVLNEHNEIVGLVTGRGLTTGQMYVARTNDLTDWLSPKAQCGGRSNASVRTYGTPPPKPGCDTPGSSSGGTSGTTSGGTSGGTSGSTSGASGGTSGGTSGSTSGASGGTSGGTSGASGGTSGSSGNTSGSSGTSGDNTSGGGSSSGGTDNPSCHDGGGHCHGDCHGVPNDNSSSGSSSGSSGTSGNTSSGGTSSGSSGQTSGGTSSGGTSGSTSGGTSGGTSGSTTSSGGTSGTSGNTSSGSTSGSSGQTSGGTSGTTSSGGTSGGTSGTTSSGGTSGTSGNTSSGSTSGSSGQTSGGTSGTTSGGTSSGGTSSSGGAGSENNGDSESCEGSSDNPETCPVEPDGCTGGSCGGAFAPDNNIDYGGCSSCSSGDSGDPLVVK